MPRQPHPVAPGDFDLPLREASVQAIQLELVRRTSFNAMDGEKVVESLFRHGDLWQAVILDRLGHVNYNRPRDLRLCADQAPGPWNDWNADMLYLLSRDVATAETLAQVIRDEDWGGEVRVHSSPDEIGTTLGGDDEKGIVSVWWD